MKGEMKTEESVESRQHGGEMKSMGKSNEGERRKNGEGEDENVIEQ
jgi:hypothetical protein